LCKVDIDAQETEDADFAERRAGWRMVEGSIVESTLCLTATSLNRIQVRPYARVHDRVVSWHVSATGATPFKEDLCTQSCSLF
jgi:hypothetical protein